MKQQEGDLTLMVLSILFQDFKKWAWWQWVKVKRIGQPSLEDQFALECDRRGKHSARRGNQ